ncbi:uncharacterized protein N7529_003411 [Penicillium soppii]|uniref:uncharacterized protein n=1 Tax=Penicillium soppii TaxID=69789 RepID=UPI0025499061|nr:uncharacterized protein N7529_003411 [Penicillium soppii]KAJ5874981.1 hypothetical protein N7529_003411 [Penicillium soppii]
MSNWQRRMGGLDKFLNALPRSFPRSLPNKNLTHWLYSEANIIHLSTSNEAPIPVQFIPALDLEDNRSSAVRKVRGDGILVP